MLTLLLGIVLLFAGTEVTVLFAGSISPHPGSRGCAVRRRERRSRQDAAAFGGALSLSEPEVVRLRDVVRVRVCTSMIAQSPRTRKPKTIAHTSGGTRDDGCSS